jgi:hypothetical protein
VLTTHQRKQEETTHTQKYKEKFGRMSTNGIRKNLVYSGGDSGFGFAQRP